MDTSQVLTSALDIGEQMLVSGAEVYRVEDCIRRICFAYGAVGVDAFTITSSIVLTIEEADGHRETQSRRIERAGTDLDRVDRLNRLSRQMCQEQMDYEEFQQHFRKILKRPRYPYWVETLFYAVAAGAFTVFFGGSWLDVPLSMLIGAILRQVVWLMGELRFNAVISSVICSFCLSLLAIVGVHFGLALSVDMVVIGNIMLLIPGAGLTNSIRDMISGDTMAGILRFCESCIIALAIASGYLLANHVVGGFL